jgi:tetratricopeptide (TPR) repeat protein
MADEAERPVTPAEGSVENVAQRLLRFATLKSSGFAQVLFSSEIARQAVLARLKSEGLSIHDQTLVVVQDGPNPAFDIDRWFETATRSGTRLISLVLTALPGAEFQFIAAAGRLNLLREALGASPQAFLLWLTPAWRRLFIEAIPDFDSWILLRLDLIESTQPTVQPPLPEIESPDTLPSSEAAYLASQAIEEARASASPSNSLTLFARAVEHLLRGGLVQQARSVANAALSQLDFYQPADSQQYSDRALLWAASANAEKAWMDLSRARDLEPDSANATPGQSEESATRSLKLLEKLGASLEAQGLYSDAEPFLLQAWELGHRVLGPEHLDTLSAAGDLAHLLMRQGRYAEAEKRSMATLAAYERTLGPDHPSTLSEINNLALLYRHEGRYAEAERLYQRALEASERVLGAEHPATLSALNNLAVVFESQGRLPEAEPLQLRALDARERVLGPDHPLTLNTQNNLAYLYASLNRLPEAEALYKKVFASRERMLGPNHPDTLNSANNMASLFQMQGRLDDAEELYNKALEARERVLGHDHPDTLTSVNNLAGIYHRQARYAEAEPLLQRTVCSLEKLQGPDHPDTLISVNNLAGLYRSEGRVDEARPLFERALSGLRIALGDSHPTVLSVQENLDFLDRTADPESSL